MDSFLKSEKHMILRGIRKGYANLSVLHEINLNIKKGEFIAIIGKSGCGKSTLLRLMAGLEEQCSGMIYMNDLPLEKLNTQAKIMFQDGRLLPWKDVLDNVCIGLSKKGKSKGMEALKNVGLEEKMNEWPGQLSGGQKQRVALARALVHNPELLLLDEPLGALDALTRIEMQRLIEKLWEKKKFTSILITHDVEEAVTLADRVILIEDGLVALDESINLPRPRERVQEAFSYYHSKILNRIIGRKKDQKTSDTDVIDLAAFHSVKNTSNT